VPAVNLIGGFDAGDTSRANAGLSAWLHGRNENIFKIIAIFT